MDNEVLQTGRQPQQDSFLLRAFSEKYYKKGKTEYEKIK